MVRVYNIRTNSFMYYVVYDIKIRIKKCISKFLFQNVSKIFCKFYVLRNQIRGEWNTLLMNHKRKSLINREIDIEQNMAVHN